MTELQILTAIDNNGGRMKFAELMNLGKTDQNWMPNADHQRICQLIDAKVLSGKTEAYGSISFGEKGVLRYQDLILQQEADRKAREASEKEQLRLQRELASKQAKEYAEKKRQRIFEIFLAIFSALLSNIDRIVPWFISLF